MRTIENMIGESEEFKELFRRSPVFNKSIHALANGVDEIKVIAELSKIILVQTDELNRFFEKTGPLAIKKREP